jgi:hypothetical protein
MPQSRGQMFRHSPAGPIRGRQIHPGTHFVADNYDHRSDDFHYRRLQQQQLQPSLNQRMLD